METEMKDGKQDEAHGERHADAIGLHPNRICMNTRDRRRALRISVAVLTTKTNMAAVRLWVEQLWRIRHLQLQGSADDADPMLRTSAPNRSESGEDDFAHKKNQGIRSAASAVGTRCRSAERASRQPTSAGLLLTPGHLPPHRECHE